MALRTSAACGVQRSAAGWPSAAVAPVKRRVATSAAAQQQSDKRQAGLADLSGGWGVEVPANNNEQPQQRTAKRLPKQQPAKQAEPSSSPSAAAASSAKAKRQSKRTSTPYVPLQSPEGRFGLALLGESLAAKQQQQQQQQQQQDAPAQQQEAAARSIQDVKASLSAAAPVDKRRKPYAVPARTPASASASASVVPGVDGIDEDDFDELSSTPSFQLTFSERGKVRILLRLWWCDCGVGTGKLALERC